MTLKSLFTHPPATRKLFLVSYERYGQNKTFLLWCYGIDIAQLKDIAHFVIMKLRFPLFDLSQLSVYVSVFLSVFLSVLLFVCWYVCPAVLLSICLSLPHSFYLSVCLRVKTNFYIEMKV